MRLTTGEHTDTEGASSDTLGELFCGTTQPENVAALQQLAGRWTGDYFDGTTDYPADAAAVAELLTGT
ncbi:hypothetical protein J2W56_006368 [Nocardia kruczakiae]|uniref:Uncharacterized protein n=1 Tax=Nocardia kruczakiae TaxID=261477 RepID=A0ABU1XPW5_9NOCA|nr:hypothetical protein [Nocardia kruczakiae]MDR7172603.1 hypothetical protein [Nocardia kruczakiae]